MKLLHKAGASIPTPDEGTSPSVALKFAMQSMEDSISELLEATTTLDSLDACGRTMLAKCSI